MTQPQDPAQPRVSKNGLYFNLQQLVEIRLNAPQDFARVRETLTRIGEPLEGNILSQICFILFKQSRYFITHINEMRRLDGEHVDILEDDIAKRNLIISLLAEWKLLEVVDPDAIRRPVAALSKVRIIQHKDKARWTLSSNYEIGKPK